MPRLALMIWCAVVVVLPLAFANGENTVPKPTSYERAYYELAQEYLKDTGIDIHYTASGRSALIKDLRPTMFPFGISDWPLHQSALATQDRTRFPVVITGVVPVINLPDMSADTLLLDGGTLARIFLGQITSWDDAAIRRLNPGVALPSRLIAVVHRSDASGVTFTFTRYLAAVSRDWNLKVNAGTQVQWPIGAGALDDAGVALQVRMTVGSVGYVSAAQANYSALSGVRMINRTGTFVSANRRSFEAAAVSANWEKIDDFEGALVDQLGTGTWPIVSGSFVLMPKTPEDVATARKILNFFAWVYSQGAQKLKNSEFVVISGRAVELVKKSWAAEIRDANGTPIYPSPKPPRKQLTPLEKIPPSQTCFPALVC